jgi:3-oxoacyl-[acyl-carrier protein] reductase
MTRHRGTALVTGAGRGIGFAISEALGRAGFSVAMVSREEPESVAPTALLQGGRGHYYCRDITEISTNRAFLDTVEADLGTLTCLVNNAGVTSLARGDILDLAPDSFDRCVDVNLRATFFLTQAVARRFSEAESEGRYRSIITISSANADIVGENRADYCITKSALPMMTRLFAARMAVHNVAVFEIRPGIIRTGMTAPVVEKYDPYIVSGGVPMRRWGEPEDVAATAVTLATGGLPYATGIHVDIGGGMQLHRLKV